jgi:hypothetical protein
LEEVHLSSSKELSFITFSSFYCPLHHLSLALISQRVLLEAYKVVDSLVQQKVLLEFMESTYLFQAH